MTPRGRRLVTQRRRPGSFKATGRAATLTQTATGGRCARTGRARSGGSKDPGCTGQGGQLQRQGTRTAQWGTAPTTTTQPRTKCRTQQHPEESKGVTRPNRAIGPQRPARPATGPSTGRGHVLGQTTQKQRPPVGDRSSVTDKTKKEEGPETDEGGKASPRAPDTTKRGDARRSVNDGTVEQARYSPACSTHKATGHRWGGKRRAGGAKWMTAAAERRGRGGGAGAEGAGEGDGRGLRMRPRAVVSPRRQRPGGREWWSPLPRAVVHRVVQWHVDERGGGGANAGCLREWVGVAPKPPRARGQRRAEGRGRVFWTLRNFSQTIGRAHHSAASHRCPPPPDGFPAPPPLVGHSTCRQFFFPAPFVKDKSGK